MAFLCDFSLKIRQSLIKNLAPLSLSLTQRKAVDQSGSRISLFQNTIGLEKKEWRRRTANWIDEYSQLGMLSKRAYTSS